MKELIKLLELKEAFSYSFYLLQIYCRKFKIHNTS